MTIRYLFAFLLIATSIMVPVAPSHAQPYNSESHVKVAMRMIGHEVLLLNGDSTSRVLPVQKIDDRYKIEFEKEFEFEPGRIVEVIAKVVMETQISPRYLVEIQDCETHEVVYSYEVDLTNENEIIPCQTRSQPKNCYQIFFTLLESEKKEVSLGLNAPFSNQSNTSGTDNNKLVWVILPLFILLGLLIWVRTKKKKPKKGPEIIHIGEYEFDKLNMQLSFKNKTTELSGKESDLLFLLYTSVNTTLERESILKEVWGDEGDYVGRTMDVFISKLRKKLANDSNLKIINIRGVGYKFVVNG